MKLPVIKVTVPDNRQAGARIRQLRTANGITLTSLAEHLAISPPHLHDLEDGSRSWTAERFDAAQKFVTKNK